MAALRAFLGRLPTPVRVALWIAASGALSALVNALRSGQLMVDPTLTIELNLLLVILRELLDRVAPASTGAEKGSTA